MALRIHFAAICPAGHPALQRDSISRVLHDDACEFYCPTCEVKWVPSDAERLYASERIACVVDPTLTITGELTAPCEPPIEMYVFVDASTLIRHIQFDAVDVLSEPFDMTLRLDVGQFLDTLLPLRRLAAVCIAGDMGAGADSLWRVAAAAQVAPTVLARGDENENVTPPLASEMLAVTRNVSSQDAVIMLIANDERYRGTLETIAAAGRTLEVYSSADAALRDGRWYVNLDQFCFL